jgi:hypothetical protein
MRPRVVPSQASSSAYSGPFGEDLSPVAQAVPRGAVDAVKRDAVRRQALWKAHEHSCWSRCRVGRFCRVGDDLIELARSAGLAVMRAEGWAW